MLLVHRFWCSCRGGIRSCDNVYDFMMRLVITDASVTDNVSPWDVTLWWLLFNLLQDGLDCLKKLLLFYVCINTDQNVLFSPKPFF